ncbi:MAG TPA: diguanylate cyclase [Armatimonadota bacterium]|jgi:two-component system cell cycle response regulator|nr:diguanylate cyclase [Armatimonadota bacterium]HOM80422.1 diguanylate cyclase [Armatimonadota bacterium]HOQ30776.1 diguanylate cyclase [Armatimonadota bacterium]HPO72006.1 diguanylate cyclase [Armatimonadota bacterium]HPT98954.1 diguanylate cyclase [Armatimonadota bacterium]
MDQTGEPLIVLRGRRVLVADDEPESIDLVSTILVSEDYQVLSTTHGDEVLHQARLHQPDLILMDLEMPGMDGLSVAQALRHDERTQHIPVIFVTASAALENKLRALREGANDYITKPFHREELLARVNVALRLKALQDALRERNRLLAELATHDELTRLHNRRYLEQRLSEEVPRAKRYRLPLSCLMLDLDHFKRINDTYGHPAGDAVLRQVADILRTSVRSVDVVGRYGGEEFLIILPQTGAEGARVLAERIRQRVEQELFDIGGQTIHCTTSIGVAAASDGDVPDAGHLIAEADRALYHAKVTGRNRVSSAP